MKPRLLLLVLLAGRPAGRCRHAGLFLDRRERRQAFLRFAAAAEREGAEDQGARQRDHAGRAPPTQPSPTHEAAKASAATGARRRRRLRAGRHRAQLRDRAQQPDMLRQQVARRRRRQGAGARRRRRKQAIDRAAEQVKFYCRSSGARDAPSTPRRSQRSHDDVRARRAPGRRRRVVVFRAAIDAGWLARRSVAVARSAALQWRDAKGRLQVTDTPPTIGRTRRSATIRTRMSCPVVAQAISSRMRTEDARAMPLLESAARSNRAQRHAPFALPSRDRQGSARRRGNRQPPADAARRHDAQARGRHLHVVAARACACCARSRPSCARK